MNEIREKVKILSKDGKVINPGYCYKNNYIYNRKKIKCRESRIKEWEFYQFYEDIYIIQMTIGHATIFDSFNFTMFTLDGLKRYECSMLKLHHKYELIYPNTENDHILSYNSKKYNISFELKDNKRYLRLNAIDKKLGEVKVNIIIDNDYNNDKMNILIPFKQSPYMFYLNYKENYYHAVGDIYINNEHYEFNNLKGLIDSGRGYWPYEQEWIWSSMTTTINDVDLGWNLGYGFGDLSNATENMIFINHKGYQLGEIISTLDWNNTFKDFTIKDKKNMLYISFIPVFDNYTQTKALWVNNKCHQVFFKASGYMSDGEKKYEFKDINCFLEHAHNHW